MASPSLLGVEDKVIAITGAASGIGYTIAKLVHSRGAHVALADFNTDGLAKAAASLPGDSGGTGKVTHTSLDVRNSASVNDWIAATVESFGRLDGAANFAGVSYDWGKIVDTSDEIWDRVMGINAQGVFNCMRAEMKHMKDGASIVNAASVAGMSGFPGIAVYAASKHAVIGLTKAAAMEVGDRNIRVNAVAPGLIDTPMTKDLNVPLNHCAFKRRGLPEEVARTVAFLLSNESTFTTGTIVPVDGGWLT